MHICQETPHCNDYASYAIHYVRPNPSCKITAAHTVPREFDDTAQHGAYLERYAPRSMAIDGRNRPCRVADKTVRPANAPFEAQRGMGGRGRSREAQHQNRGDHRVTAKMRLADRGRTACTKGDQLRV